MEFKLSGTKISTAKGCWKKYFFRYVEHLKPIDVDVKLTIGKVIHQCFENVYKGASDTEQVTYINNTFQNEISKAEPADVEKFELARYTALGMWTYCPNKKPSEFQSIEPEKEFTVKVPHVRGVTFTGKLDGLIQYDNSTFIREVKTTGLNEKQFVGRVRTSSQATGYVWAAKKLGYDPKGIMFDAIRKPLLKKRESDDMHSFGKRIVQDYKDRPDFYYQRTWTYRTQADLDIFERDLIHFVKTLRIVTRRGRFYRNTDQCWNFNSECPYSKVCFQEQPDRLMLDLFFKRGEGYDEPREIG
jgi:hypothetical protein